MGNIFSAGKQCDDEVTIPEKGTLPDISAATPKVSLFDFQQGVGPGELVKSCIEQTVKYGPIATQKVGFMALNQQTKDSKVIFTPTVILNATGVRLSLVSFKGLPDYPAPAVIEPGECASFLAPGAGNGVTEGVSVTPVSDVSVTDVCIYEAQVFEGPVAFPANPANLVGGWTAPTGELKISQFRFQSGTLGQRTGFVNPSTATARVQVEARGDLAASTLTWKIILIAPDPGGAGGPITQYALTQSLG